MVRPPEEEPKNRSNIASEKMAQDVKIRAFKMVHEALEPLSKQQATQVLRSICVIMDIEQL